MNKVWAEVLELIHWVLELILCSIWSSEWDELSRFPSGDSFLLLLPSRTPCQLVLSSPLPERHLRPHSFSPFGAL